MLLTSLWAHSKLSKIKITIKLQSFFSSKKSKIKTLQQYLIFSRSSPHPQPLSTKLVNGHMTNRRYQTLIFIIGVGNMESHKNRDLILNIYLHHTICMTMNNLIFLCLSLSICKICNNTACHLGLFWGEITIFFFF